MVIGKDGRDKIRFAFCDNDRGLFRLMIKVAVGKYGDVREKFRVFVSGS